MASSNAHSTKEQEFFPSVSQVVLDKIMRTVPLQVLLRWRLVCKTWNQIIMSKRWTSGTNLRSQISIPLLLVNCRQGSTTSASFLALSSNDKNGKWIKISIDLEEAASTLYKKCEHYTPLCSEFLRCTAAGSLGLMFLTRNCASHFDPDFSLIVYNPVTGNSKSLEIPPEHQHMKSLLSLAGVIVDRDEQHYKLLFSTVTRENDLTFRTYFVYDSRTCSWKFKLSSGPPFFHITSKVSCNGCLYFLHTSSMTAAVDGGWGTVTAPLFKPQLGIYNAERDRWHGVERSLMPEHERPPHFPQLVQHKGTILYVVLCRSEVERREDEANQSPLKTWCFFQLVTNRVGPDYAADDAPSSSCSSTISPRLRIRWRKVREMPRSVFDAFDVCSREFHELETGRYDVCCEGQGDFMYFYCVKPLRRTSMSSSSSGEGRACTTEGVVLLHDFEKNEWSFLKRYPPFDSNDVSSVRLESFRPSFMDI